MADIAAGKKHAGIGICISTESVCITDNIVCECRVSLHLLGSVNDIIDVGDKLEVVIPSIVRTPSGAIESILDIVEIVIPEPT